jgi:hypothetical protein
MASQNSASSDEALEEARFRARMARVGSGAGASTPHSRRVRDDEEDEKGRGFRLGWFGWLLIDTAIVLGTVAAVVVWPPIETCRAHEKEIGFYAGETVETCIRRGVAERISNADQRIKMMLRGSGR